MKEKNIIQRAHLFTHIYEPDEIAKEYQKSLKQVLKLYKKLKHDNDLMQAEFERLEDLEDDRDILKYRIRELEKENQAYLEELAGDKTAISLLYQKEKSRIMELAELLDKQESEIKSLEQELEIQKGYSISKDKIREKLDYQYMLWNTPNRQKEYSQEVVEILEELLEEK